MWKKILCYILSLIMLFTLTGCDEQDKKKGEYHFFYMNLDMSILVPEE